jgi:hypothetical protein
MHGSDVPKADTSATPYNTAGMTTSPNITARENHSSLSHAANHSKPAQINSVRGNPTRQIFLTRQTLSNSTQDTHQVYMASKTSQQGKYCLMQQPNTGHAHQDLTMRSSSRAVLIKLALIFSCRIWDYRSSKERLEKPVFLK